MKYDGTFWAADENQIPQLRKVVSFSAASVDVAGCHYKYNHKYNTNYKYCQWKPNSTIQEKLWAVIVAGCHYRWRWRREDWLYCKTQRPTQCRRCLLGELEIAVVFLHRIANTNTITNTSVNTNKAWFYRNPVQSSCSRQSFRELEGTRRFTNRTTVFQCF